MFGRRRRRRNPIERAIEKMRNRSRVTTNDAGQYVCSKCQSVINTSGSVCPNCDRNLYTIRGKLFRVLGGLFGFSLGLYGLQLLGSGSITGIIGGIISAGIGIPMFLLAAYYLFKRPVISLNPFEEPSNGQGRSRQQGQQRRGQASQQAPQQAPAQRQQQGQPQGQQDR